MRRILYVDGFNFYYGVTKYWREQKGLAGLGWCNFRALVERNFQDEGELHVKYFTAPVREGTPQRNPGEFQRYALWMGAVRTIPGLTVIEGFYKRDREASRPDSKNKIREEKQTDVNLAVELLMDALGPSESRPDRVYLLSDDGDLMPAVFALEERVGIPVTVLLPSRSDAERWKRMYGETRDRLRRIHFSGKATKTGEVSSPLVRELDEKMLANSLLGYELGGDLRCLDDWRLPATYLDLQCKQEWRPDRA
jgi:hypothetical protein